MKKFLRTFAPGPQVIAVPMIATHGVNNSLPLVLIGTFDANGAGSGDTVTITMPAAIIPTEIRPIAAMIREVAGSFKAVTMTSYSTSTGVLVLTTGAAVAALAEVRVICG